MKILGIETSSNIGSVAVCDNDFVIDEQSFGEGMRCGKHLMPAVKSIFEKNGLKPKDIDLISISVGPGSYTGLRVGITCVKTLSYALKKPVIDIPSMDVIVQNVRVKYDCICPVIDAKRKLVYACIYKYAPEDQLFFHANPKHSHLTQPIKGDLTSVNLWESVSELLIISPNDIVNKLPKKTLVFGDGVSCHTEIFENGNMLIGNNDMGIPKASIVAMLGKYEYAKGKRCDINALSPIYLHKPGVE
ncbi:MAG: tRNA (adenosine(37)-N6)-threonylcarbamoyltransferase complex dimerization subunit type 1 TsaB [Candidatus Anammoxibacter sp.]